MHLKIGIVEDSLENISTLRYLLQQVDTDVELLGEARTLDEARVLLKQEMDLAILDIQLKEGTIFEVLEEFHIANEPLPEIVFATAHGSFEYATKAIQFACLDFLTKPLAAEDLSSVLDKVRRKHAQKVIPPDQVGFLLQLLRGNMQAPKSIGIIMPKGVMEFVDLGEVLFFQADENTCLVHLNENTLHSTKHFGYYLDLLSGNLEYVQISKSCLVNTEHIKRYNHREKDLLLKNGSALVVSHRFSKHVKQALLDMGSRAIKTNIFGGLLK